MGKVSLDICRKCGVYITPNSTGMCKDCRKRKCKVCGNIYFVKTNFLSICHSCNRRKAKKEQTGGDF